MSLMLNQMPLLQQQLPPLPNRGHDTHDDCDDDDDAVDKVPVTVLKQHLVLTDDVLDIQLPKRLRTDHNERSLS